MKSNIKVVIVAHPGKVSEKKASKLMRDLKGMMLGNQVFMAAVEKRIAENKKEVTNVTE